MSTTAGRLYQNLEPREGKLLFLLCWTAYFATYMGRLNYSAAMPELIQEGILNKPQAGYISTAFFACYGIGTFFWGFLGDRLSPFVMVGTGMGVSAAVNLAMAFSPGYPAMLLLWGLNGLFQSMIWAPIIRMLAQLLPEEMRARACIHINSTTACGTLGSYLLAPALIQAGGWRWVFAAISVILAIVSCIWLAGHRKLRPHLHMEPAPIPTEQKDHPSALFPPASLALLLVLLLPTAIHGILKDGIATWAPTLLTERFGLASHLAVLLTVVLPVVNLAGAYLLDLLNRRLIRNDLLTAALCFCACATALVVVHFAIGAGPFFAVAMLAVSTATMLGVNVTLITVIPMHLGRSGNAATATGILNSAAYGGCAVSMAVFGRLSERTGWDGTIIVWVLLAVAAGILTFTALPRWRRFQSTL